MMMVRMKSIPNMTAEAMIKGIDETKTTWGVNTFAGTYAVPRKPARYAVKQRQGVM
jgi:hypothetical protein